MMRYFSCHIQVLALSFFLLGVGALPGQAKVDDYAEEILRYDVDIRLETDGRMQVTEKIDYDFDYVEAHGIYRSLPYRYRRGWINDNLEIDLKSVTDEMGGPWPVEQVPPGDFGEPAGSLVWRVGDPETYVTGKQTYVFTYLVDFALDKFDIHDELYWNAIGTSWQVPIRNAAVTVHLPPEYAEQLDPTFEKKFFPTCYTGVYGSEEQHCSVVAEGDSILFEITEDLEAYEGFTVVVALPKGVIAEPSAGQAAAHLLFNNWSWPAVPVLLVILIVWLAASKSAKPSRPLIPIYEPPEQLPPHTVEYIDKNEVSEKSFAATLLKLARDGVLHFVYDQKEGEVTKLKKVAELPETAEWMEQTVFKRLFGSGVTEIEVKKTTVDRVKLTSDAENKDDELMKQRGWKDEALRKRLGRLAGVLWLALLGGIVLAIYGGNTLQPHAVVTGISGVVISIVGLVFKAKRRPLTQAGADLKRQVDGFKWFLRVTQEERLKFTDAPRLTPTTFEQLLPYAVAFGVEKEWVDQFEEILKEPPRWLEGAPRQYPYMQKSILATVYITQSFRSPAPKVSSRPTGISRGGTTSRGSSGFGGGGFSGGGGGGGGGGRW